MKNLANIRSLISLKLMGKLLTAICLFSFIGLFSACQQEQEVTPAKQQGAKVIFKNKLMDIEQARKIAKGDLTLVGEGDKMYAFDNDGEFLQWTQQSRFGDELVKLYHSAELAKRMAGTKAETTQDEDEGDEAEDRDAQWEDKDWGRFGDTGDLEAKKFYWFVVLYDGWNLTGHYIKLFHSDPNLKNNGFDERTTSVNNKYNKYWVILFKKLYYKGDKLFIPPFSYLNYVGPYFNNQTSSVLFVYKKK